MKKIYLLALSTILLFSTACASIESENGISAVSKSESESSEYTVSQEATDEESSIVEFFESVDNVISTEESSATESSELGNNESGTESEIGGDSTGESKTETESKPDNNQDSSVSEPENNDSSSISTVEPDGKVFVSNGILIAGTRGMEQYYGSENSGTQYSACVSAFKNDLADNVNVYSIVVPHASCYYAPEEYANLLTRGQVNFNNLKNTTASNVNYVDVYATLANHVDEDIYPRTEHHWNALGAYYAAEEFAKMAGVNFDSLDTYETIVKEGFVGSLYAFSKSSVLSSNPENFTIYKPTREYTAYFCNEGNYDFEKYNYSRDTVVFNVKSYAGAFLGGDSVWVKIVTGNNTGRKLVIFKDSYGNAFVPFTVGSFDEIYVVDIRNYRRNGVKLCEDVGATDVAFVVSGFTATGSVYKNIERIRTAY